jgi:hypothetical protein
MMLAQSGQRARRPNPVGRRVQPEAKQNARVGRRAARRLAARLDTVVETLKVQAFNEGPHSSYRVIIDYQALKVDHFKTSLATFRPSNPNVHHVLQINARNESRHFAEKMTGPSLRSSQ